jgi:hypothetical protein
VTGRAFSANGVHGFDLTVFSAAHERAIRAAMT